MFYMLVVKKAGLVPAFYLGLQAGYYPWKLKASDLFMHLVILNSAVSVGAASAAINAAPYRG